MVENSIFHCLVEREREREKWWGLQVFSPPPSKNNLSKLEKKLEWKVGKIFGQNYPHLFFMFLALFFFFLVFLYNVGFFFFFFFSFFFLWFCQVVGSSSFPSFFFLNFNFIIFLRKHFWMISYAIFWNVHFHLYTIYISENSLNDLDLKMHITSAH